MQKYPIGSCCSRPRFNFVGGVDDDDDDDDDDDRPRSSRWRWRTLKSEFRQAAFRRFFERALKIGRVVVGPSQS